ncbi:MAG TPA: transposase [Desulfobacteria bacterium]|nr:transposase [Desulfobacteria bacterium]
MELGKVIWVGQTRRKEAFDAFFTELGAPKSSLIQAFVMDTWDPYIASVHENTNAVIVFDLFHVARKITEAVLWTRCAGRVRQCGRGNAQEVQEDTFSDSEAREEVGCNEEKRETLNALMVDNERLYCIRRIC